MYKARKLMQGYEIDKSLLGKTLVAIPDHKVVGTSVVFHGEQKMYLKKQNPLFISEPMPDKYGRGFTYRLVYFEWKPEQK